MYEIDLSIYLSIDLYQVDVIYIYTYIYTYIYILSFSDRTEIDLMAHRFHGPASTKRPKSFCESWTNCRLPQQTDTIPSRDPG